jgi:hypothetical protein
MRERERKKKAREERKKREKPSLSVSLPPGERGASDTAKEFIQFDNHPPSKEGCHGSLKPV